MPETQGKTEKDNINGQENQEQNQHQILRIKTGALSELTGKQHTTTRKQSVLSYPPRPK